jgi:hypothetical protein
VLAGLRPSLGGSPPMRTLDPKLADATGRFRAMKLRTLAVNEHRVLPRHNFNLMRMIFLVRGELVKQIAPWRIRFPHAVSLHTQTIPKNIERCERTGNLIAIIADKHNPLTTVRFKLFTSMVCRSLAKNGFRRLIRFRLLMPVKRSSVSAASRLGNFVSFVCPVDWRSCAFVGQVRQRKSDNGWCWRRHLLLP